MFSFLFCGRKKSIINRILAILIFSLFIFNQMTTRVYAEGNCVTSAITHSHVGSKNSGGGCYSHRVSGSKTIEVSCDGTMVYNPATDTTGCDRCGAGYHGDQSGRSCFTTTTETESYTYYEIDCGKDTSTPLGSLTLTQSTQDWSQSLDLLASHELYQEIPLEEQMYLINGSATSNHVISVSENGIYTLQLNISENPQYYKANVSVEVRNIDHTPPSVASCIKEPTDWTNDGVMVTLNKIEDRQPDGTNGVGLHELAFSYDEGKTWGADTQHYYTKNGQHKILIRDGLNNIATLKTTIKTIDTMGPTVKEVIYDHTQDIKETVVTVIAEDLLEDGTEGIGLNEMPYSFDGGKTWTDQNTITITKNQTITIMVRDQLGNSTSTGVEISNLYEPPKPETKQEKMEEFVPSPPVLTPTIAPKREEKSIKEVQTKKETGEERGTKKGAIEKVTTENDTQMKEKVMPKEKPKKIQDAPPPKMNPRHNWGITEIIFLLSVILIILAGGISFLFYWYKCIRIYNEREDNQFDYVGKQWIKRKESHYEVTINEFIWEQCNTTHFQMKPSKLFLLIHKEEELYFLFPKDRCVCLKCQEIMDVVIM